MISSPLPVGVTRVRLDEATARKLLASYVFEGRFGIRRVPRGIDPEVVSAFVRDRIVPETSSAAYQRLLDVLRFYERPDVVPQLLQATLLPIRSIEALRRAAYAVQAAGELGPPDAAEDASDYVDRALVPSDQAPGDFPTLLETRVVLAPFGSFAALAGRIAAEVARAKVDEERDEASMMAYDKVVAVQRNALVHARGLAAAKTRLSGLPQAARRDELVAIYLEQAPIRSELVGVWAARLLREEALTADPRPVHEAFARAIDALDRGALGDELADFTLVLAAQAIVYLGGTLSPAHAQAFAAAKVKVAGFLWDDP